MVKGNIWNFFCNIVYCVFLKKNSFPGPLQNNTSWMQLVISDSGQLHSMWKPPESSQTTHFTVYLIQICLEQSQTLKLPDASPNILFSVSIPQLTSYFSDLSKFPVPYNPHSSFNTKYSLVCFQVLYQLTFTGPSQLGLNSLFKFQALF